MKYPLQGPGSALKTQMTEKTEAIRLYVAAPLADGKTFHITASFGIAFMVPGMPAAEAIRRADIAVYAAKEAGRNCTRIWSPGMTVQPVA